MGPSKGHHGGAHSDTGPPITLCSLATALTPCLSFEWGFSQMKFPRIIIGIVLLKAW